MREGKQLISHCLAPSLPEEKPCTLRAAAGRAQTLRPVNQSVPKKRCKFKKTLIATLEGIIQILCAVILLLFLISRPVLLVFQSLVALDVEPLPLYVLCYDSSMM